MTHLTLLSQAMSSVEQRLAHENLYRDSTTLIYGDNKPSEEAIDRVVSKINKECVTHGLRTSSNSKFCILFSIDKRGKFSRRRLNETEGDITYINEQNRVFNKKVTFCPNLRHLVVDLECLSRLLGITTSTLPRFGPASNEELLCNLCLALSFPEGPLVCCISYISILPRCTRPPLFQCSLDSPLWIETLPLAFWTWKVTDAPP
jgi:hypothetical protein